MRSVAQKRDHVPGMISFRSIDSRCRTLPPVERVVAIDDVGRARHVVDDCRNFPASVFDPGAALFAVHRRQVVAFIIAPAIGCLISWLSDAASSPIMLTRLMRARSAS